MKPRIYIAGPMTGLPESNYPAFNAAAAVWRALGWDVANPAEHFGGAQDRTYLEYIEVDVNELLTCDAIAMLPEWNSKTARGSVWENVISRKMLHIPVYDATQPVAPPEIIDSGEILPVSYDEYRAFQAWRGRKQVSESVRSFLDEVIGAPIGSPIRAPRRG